MFDQCRVFVTKTFWLSDSLMNGIDPRAQCATLGALGC